MKSKHNVHANSHLRIILYEESNYCLQRGKGNSVCSQRGLNKALRKHEEFFVLFQRETLSVSLLSNQSGVWIYLEQSSLFVNFSSFFINVSKRA